MLPKVTQNPEALRFHTCHVLSLKVRYLRGIGAGRRVEDHMRSGDMSDRGKGKGWPPAEDSEGSLCVSSRVFREGEARPGRSRRGGRGG